LAVEKFEATRCTQPNFFGQIWIARKDIAAITRTFLFHKITNALIGHFQSSVRTQSLTVLWIKHNDSRLARNRGLGKVTHLKPYEMLYTGSLCVGSTDLDSLF